jgi:hypothetical protein
MLKLAQEHETLQSKFLSNLYNFIVLTPYTMERTKIDLNTTVWIKPTEIEKSRKWYIVDAQ